MKKDNVNENERGTRMTGLSPRDQSICAAYKNGAARSQLSAAYKLSVSRINSLLRDAGVEPRIPHHPAYLVEERNAKILAAFDAGASLYEIAASAKMSYGRVRQIIAAAGLNATEWFEKRLKSRDELIRTAYLEGQSIEFLAEAYDLTERRVRQIVTLSGVELRGRTYTRSHELNEEAFDVPSPERDYWVGFLMADGGISDTGDGQTAIVLNLESADTAHVERFRTFVGSSHAISDIIVKNPSGTFSHKSRFSVRSNQLAASLAKFGVTPRKSQTAKVISLENSIDFWRGLTDGDGSLFIATINGYEHPRYSLAVSEPMWHQFVTFASAHIPGLHVGIRPKRSQNDCVTANLSRNVHVITLLKLLYDNNCVALYRKQAKAYELIARWG